MTEAQERLESAALAPLIRSGVRFRLLIAALCAVIGLGAYAYSVQISRGLSVTGMADAGNKIPWGLYVTNFVFFIGISHAGTLISAILRASHASWRVSITRMAEFITVVALMVGALLPIIDLGRPDRIGNVFVYGRWQSAILWDLFAITTYLAGSLLYLWLPLIPDLALARDRLGGRVGSIRGWLHRRFSIGWTGAPEQRRSLAGSIALMMAVIIPVAVSVHTVVSWIFGMTMRTGWNTAVFGIYFVAGAIFSGIAMLIVVMAILRKVFHLEEWVTPTQFVNLGTLMAIMGLVMIYFNVSEFLTEAYKLEGQAPAYLNQIFTGSFAPMYWGYVVAGLLSPGIVMLSRRLRRPGWIVASAALVVAAMWIERYIIVVASQRVPQMPYLSPASYLPTGVELAITAGMLSLFALIIAMFTRLFPVVSVWEIREQAEAAASVVTTTQVSDRRAAEPVTGS